jgi:hypothetical protein
MVAVRSRYSPPRTNPPFIRLAAKARESNGWIEGFELRVLTCTSATSNDGDAGTVLRVWLNAVHARIEAKVVAAGILTIRPTSRMLSLPRIVQPVRARRS